MSRLTALALVVLIAVAGCGSAGGARSKVAVGTGLGQKSVTRAEALALVQRLNLSTKDLPGVTATPQDESAVDRRTDEKVERCAGGELDSMYVADANSPYLESGVFVVTSEVSVLPSIAATRRDLAAASGPNAFPCERRYSGDYLPKGTILESITLTRPSRPAFVAKGSVDILSLSTVSGRGRVLQVVSDSIVVQRGDVEVSLTCSDNAGKSIPVALVRLAYRALLKKVDAALPGGGLAIVAS